MFLSVVVFVNDLFALASHALSSLLLWFYIPRTETFPALLPLYIATIQIVPGDHTLVA